LLIIDEKMDRKVKGRHSYRRSNPGINCKLSIRYVDLPDRQLSIMVDTFVVDMFRNRIITPLSFN